MHCQLVGKITTQSVTITLTAVKNKPVGCLLNLTKVKHFLPLLLYLDCSFFWYYETLLPFREVNVCNRRWRKWRQYDTSVRRWSWSCRQGKLLKHTHLKVLEPVVLLPSVPSQSFVGSFTGRKTSVISSWFLFNTIQASRKITISAW